MGTRERPNLNCWCDHWVEDSPLINKFKPNMEHLIDQNAKVSDFITNSKQWNLNYLINIYRPKLLTKLKQYQHLSRT